jgi:signal transduction histidine kinase
MGVDLPDHLRTTATRMLAGRELRWKCADPLPAEWAETETRRHIFLFFKETLTNIVRHSRARIVEFRAREVGALFELEIRDDGCGFNPLHAGGGVGLQSLRQRARALRGTCTIASEPHGGTRVVLQVPRMIRSARDSRMGGVQPEGISWQQSGS